MYNNDFYNSLKKPSFAPPASIFKVVWPILYILMFISIYMILTTENKLRFWAIGLFCSQLLLNFCWSPVFFVLKQIRTALLICIILTLNVLLMVILFLNISAVAGIIQIPYFLWLCFATYLNLEFIRLNPDIDE